jgi:hypothetical protein
MPAQRHPDSGSGRRVPVEHRRLPAAPLLAAIGQLADRRHLPLEELLGEGGEDGGAWALRTVRGARAAGELTVQAGERLCDQVLGWHPRMVWGGLYDRTIADDTPHTAAAPPGTLTGWRQGCRCLDCREANRTTISTRRTHRHQGGERPA